MSRAVLVSFACNGVLACAVSMSWGQAVDGTTLRTILLPKKQEAAPGPIDSRANPTADVASKKKGSDYGGGVLKAHFHCDFRAGHFDEDRLRLVGRPDALAREAEGLSVQLAAGAHSLVNPGVNSRFRIGGDFQITAAYEILAADTPADNKDAGSWMRIQTDAIPPILPGAGYQRATFLGVMDHKKRHLFITNHAKSSKGRPPRYSVKRINGQARRGRLRLVRSGDTLRWLVAEGDDSEFRQLRTANFSRNEIGLLWLSAEKSDPTVSVNVRWIDLDVWAERLPGTGTSIVTIENQHISGHVVDAKDGRLRLSSGSEDSDVEIPLDELYRIDFDPPSSFGVNWIGQDGRDAAQGSPEVGGDGLVDVHLVVEGLRPDRDLKQITIVLHKPGKKRTWQLDTKTGLNWKLAVERLRGASRADVYLQPGSEDRFEHEFAISVTYDDSTTTSTRGKLAIHTQGDLQIDGTNANATGPRTGVLVDLSGGDRLFGRFLSLDQRSLTIQSVWGDEISIPLIHVRAVRFIRARSTSIDTVFTGLLKEPPEEDIVLVRTSDGSATQISGGIGQIADGKLSLHYDGELRLIRTQRVFGWVFAQRPAFGRGANPYQVFLLAGGDAISGEFLGFNNDRPEIKTAWGAVLRVPQTALSGIRFHNGKMVYLSDLDPVEVEEVPYFDRLVAHRRDRALDGGPLAIGDTTYEKGLAVHSRCVLTYALDGQFATFRAVLGFDTRTSRAGRAKCRVLGDGEELFAVDDLSAVGEPRELNLSIAGVRRLSLEVDFGANEDIGDRVNWARARVFRAAPK